MTRKEISELEIISQLEERINQITEVVEDGEFLKVGGLTKLAEFDANGCNWSVHSITNSKAYLSSISKIVQELQTQFNLKN